MRLQREQSILFRQFPIIVGHTYDVAAPGQFFTHDETGVPILVTRTREGQVKAYHERLPASRWTHCDAGQRPSCDVFVPLSFMDL